METLSALERSLWRAETAALALAALRLAWDRLALRYRWLAIFLGFQLARNAALMCLRYNTNAYAYTWAATLVLKWALSAMVAREIAGMILENYRGLSVLSRRTLASLTVMCGAGALAMVSFSFDYSREPFPLLRTVLLFEQGMAAALFLILLLAALFLLWFPVPLPANTLAYSAAFSLSLVTAALAVAAITLGGAALTRSANLAMLAADIVCFSFLAWRLRRGREEGPRMAAIPRGAEAEQRLLSQLAALNRALESRGKSQEIGRG